MVAKGTSIVDACTEFLLELVSDQSDEFLAVVEVTTHSIPKCSGGRMAPSYGSSSTWEFFRARERFFPIPLRRSQKKQLCAESVTWYRRYGISDRCVPLTLHEFEARFDETCREQLELTPAVQLVLDSSTTPRAPAEPTSLPGPLSPLNGFARHMGAEVLRAIVYGSMPDVLRRRFGFSWTHADRVRFATVCGALRGMDPAVRRGALSEIYPEGTPRLAPGNRNKVITSGPGRRRAGSNKRTAG
ncbi:MAG: oxygenase MpaB family protein [Microthrixaceae bacterium]